MAIKRPLSSRRPIGPISAPQGPLGRDLFFADDNKNIIVMLGMAEASPPVDIQVQLEETVNREINEALINAGADIDINKQTAKLSIGDNPSERQRKMLDQGILSIQQYDVKTELEEVSMELVNAVHNSIVEEVDKLGFNILGTETKVV